MRLGVPLDDEGNRWRHRRKITELFAPWFAARRVRDFEAAFNKAGLTWSVFRTVREALAQDPDLSVANPMFSEVAHPGLGTLLTPSHPAVFGQAERLPPAPAPELGADTEEILGDILRLGGREIGRLFDKGVVDGPRSGNRKSAA